MNAAATDWLDIADSAVKIGLGALITGLASWYTTRLTLRRQDAKERLAKRIADFERVAESVEGTRRAAKAFVEALGDWIVNREDAQLQRSLDRPLNQAKADLEAALLAAVLAHTRLQLMGEDDCAEALEAYRFAVDAFFRKAWNDRDGLDDPGLGALNDGLEAPRQQLVDRMRPIYQALVS